MMHLLYTLCVNTSSVSSRFRNNNSFDGAKEHQSTKPPFVFESFWKVLGTDSRPTLLRVASDTRAFFKAAGTWNVVEVVIEIQVMVVFY
jgi:hypothetical protein